MSIPLNHGIPRSSTMQYLTDLFYSKRSVFVFHSPAQELWKGPTASPMVIDPSGVYFRREGSGGHFITGVSPDETMDYDGEFNEELQTADDDLFMEIVWPTIANRVPQFESIKRVNAWAGWYEYNTFDQVNHMN